MGKPSIPSNERAGLFMPSWGASPLRRPQPPALGASHFSGSTRTEKRTYYTRYFPSWLVYTIWTVGCLDVAESNPWRGSPRSQIYLWRSSRHGVTSALCFWTTILSMWWDSCLQAGRQCHTGGRSSRQRDGTSPTGCSPSSPHTRPCPSST